MELILNAVHIVQYYILPFVVVLGIMIFFHELGHFLVAKYFGVKVEKFALGFGPVMVAKTIGETEYSIRYFPLGGFVKMLGEDIQEEDDEAEALPPGEEEKSFSNKHVFKRMAIVLAGPLFNIFLALFIFCGFYMLTGAQVMIPEVGQVTEGGPAYKAGFLKGDIITSIEGKPIESWSEIQDIVWKSAEKPLEMGVKRGTGLLTLTVVPEKSMLKNIFGEEVPSALIGIVASGKSRPVSLGFSGSIKQGFIKTWDIIELTVKTVIKLFQRIVPIKTLGGPILIGQMTGQLAQESFIYLIPFMAVISINLGILNLLPVPILDGGLLIFLLIELIIGKPLNLKMREIAQKTGLLILMMLMAVVIYNDITRFFE
ncbi:MAG: RIP metalloprotease RseP [Desulfobacterales bacterium]|nr:RIP metalloprotease RseP [Desulfobacterales bacterium]